MFVSNNTISAAKKYFYNYLGANFSATECKVMFDALLQKRLNWTKADLILQANGRLSESDLLFVRNVAHRLMLNEPFQYIIGETIFFDLNISCDYRALIPRPETEELVAWILEDGEDEIKSLLDIGTGSGCIALACKSKLDQCHVTAIDCSIDALALAKVNLEKLSLPISLIVFDIFLDDLELLEHHQGWDRIVSNPPYILEQESSSMAKNVLDFEPRLALFVPNDNPLRFYNRIMDVALHLLNDNAYLFFEIHEDFSAEISSLFKEKGFINIELRKDLQGKVRMIKAKKPTFNA